MIKEQTGVYGTYELKIFKDKEAFEKGIVQDSVKIRNKLTNASLAVISGLIGNTGSQTAFGYIAVGTSSTAVSAAHTTLQAEITNIGLGRAATTNSRTTTSQTNDTLSMTVSMTSSGSTTIEEAGVFNNSVGGTMLSRVLTGSKGVVSGNVVTVTYTLQIVGN